MTDRFVIRELRASDLDAALKLWNVSFSAGYSGQFDTKERLLTYLERNPNLSSVACLQSGELVGALLCGHDGRRGSIYHTAVYEKYRQNGIGRRMEERSLSELRQVGISTGFLFINVRNPGSAQFWQSIGWKMIEDVRYLYKEF